MGLAIDTIYGVSLGFEYVPPEDSPDSEIYSMLVIDLLVIRLAFIKYND